MKKRLLLLLLPSLLGVLQLRAQDASLRGVVSDPTGAALVGAQVTATQTERNIPATTTTGADGRYLFARLPIGNYQVTVESTGFKTYVQSDVVLTTSGEALLNITMQLGAISEQVTVSAEASRVSTDSSTLQQLVDSRRIADMPLIGRNVYTLATLVPGTGPGGMNIGGGRAANQNTTMVNIRVDGALNVDNGHSIMLPSPSPDAVHEFTIQTSIMPAQYSHASGVVNVSTKSGTNGLHGTLYEFLRNDALDARTFFQATKLKRKRNQYGFAAGGPVLLPKIYDGRNRTFWFVNFEQQKEPLTADALVYVPTEQQIAGDFSGVTRVIRDPANANQPFPNNRIPANRLDPLALNLVKAYVPAAQDSLGTHRYQRNDDNNPTQVLARGDQVLASGLHQVSGRVFITRLTRPLAAGNIPAFTNSGGGRITNTDLVGLTYTSNVAPNMINVARFAVNHYYNTYTQKPQVTLDELKAFGWAPNYYTYTPDFPVMQVSGSISMGYEWPSLTYNNHTTTFSDDFSWIRGRHSLNMGFQGIRTTQDTFNVSRTNGKYTYSGALSGLGLSDFMLGLPNAFRQGSPAPDNPHGLMLSWYIQDDIKVNSRFTLNLGLRHELPFPIVAENDAMMVYQAGAKSQVYLNAPPGLLFYGDPGVLRGGHEMQKTAFGPRAGLAYALTADQKTMLRAGYGVYYNPPWTNIDGQFAIYQPFTRIVDIATPPSTANPWANWPGGNPHPYTPSKDSTFDPQITGLAYGPDYRETQMQQWNLSIQREVAKDWLINAAYAGTRGTHIPYLRDMNPAVYIPGQSTVANINQRRPLYPYFSRFSLIETVVNSSYNSFQASLDKRFSKGFSVLLAYTFSKALGELNTTVTNDGGVQDPNNRRAEWGPADFDRTHALTSSWVWDVPAGALAHGASGVIFGGWQLNGMTFLYSGAPLTFPTSQDRALRGQPNRSDRLRDARLPEGRPRAARIAQYFDTTAYAPNAIGTFGSAPRADSRLRAPGSFNLILGAMKNFRGFVESHRAQFRTEISNALNRPNFGGPGTNIDSVANFGRITSAGDGRIIQLGLKYIF